MNKQTTVTEPNHRTAKSPKAAPKSLPPNQPGHAWAQKLGAVQRLSDDILSRIEQRLDDDPAAVVDKKSCMFPREIEDSQAYFAQKIEHARNTLRELGDLLHVESETRDARELVSTELMVLFVLIENYRPERIQESGRKLEGEIHSGIREKIESLGLDIINMRERLK